MFGWLKRLFSRGEDTYSPRERRIYRYWDGKQWIHEDPLRLYKRVMEVGPALGIASSVSMSASKDAIKAHGELIGHIQKIFGVKAYHEGGLTEAETAELLDHFMGWCDRLKKNTRATRTSPVGISEPTAPTADAPRPMPNTPDSGSTASAP